MGLSPRPSMLDLLAFDLDGTLANTESLKAQSYAWAALQLRPDLDRDRVEEAYADCIGWSRQEIATALLNRFDLGDAARTHDASVEPWESYVGLRLEHYRDMLRDVDLVQRNARGACAIARRGRELARTVAVVTTSGRQNATLALVALGLAEAFDFVVTADDVQRTKPDPEGYRQALASAQAEPERSLAIEDSPAGARAAVAAGLPVVVVPDEYTHDGIRRLVDGGTLPAAAVLSPDALAEAVRQRVSGARTAPGWRR